MAQNNEILRPHLDVNRDSFFWNDYIVVEALEHLRMPGMHRDQHFRLHGLDYVSYLVVIQVS